jgi:hypothetical protein
MINNPTVYLHNVRIFIRVHKCIGDARASARGTLNILSVTKYKTVLRVSHGGSAFTNTISL